MVRSDEPGARRHLAELRAALNAGEVGFLDACRAEGLLLAVDRVHYFSHWITPEPAPKRYDTRFFVTALPPDQVAVHDDYETVDTVWVRPVEALARARAGEFDLIFPTMKNLEAISRFTTSAELLGAAASVERVPTVLPRVVADATGFRILLPGDPGYDEAVTPPAGSGPAMTAGRGGGRRPHHRAGRARRHPTGDGAASRTGAPGGPVGPRDPGDRPQPGDDDRSRHEHLPRGHRRDHRRRPRPRRPDAPRCPRGARRPAASGPSW